VTVIELLAIGRRLFECCASSAWRVDVVAEDASPVGDLSRRRPRGRRWPGPWCTVGV